DLHDRLQQHRAGLRRALLEAHRAGDLEGHFARIDVVVRTVVQSDLDVDHRIAGDHAVLHGFPDALVDRGNVFLRHDTADDAVDDLVARPGLLRLDAQEHVPVLAAAARLPDELAFLLDHLADGLAVRDLRLADVCLDLELALHPVDDDLEVQLTHAGDDRLAGFL